MKPKNKIITSLLVIGLIFLSLFGFDIDLDTFSSAKDNGNEISINIEDKENNINKDGYYTSKEDVYNYLNNYEKLPNNFITKKEAKNLGWDNKEGNLWDVTDKKSIGGDYFGNRENRLPEKNGRKWYECDIDYNGGYRGSKRIVYSSDGLIYYTNDHYKTFTKLSD